MSGMNLSNKPNEPEPNIGRSLSFNGKREKFKKDQQQSITKGRTWSTKLYDHLKTISKKLNEVYSNFKKAFDRTSRDKAKNEYNRRKLEDRFDRILSPNTDTDTLRKKTPTPDQTARKTESEKLIEQLETHLQNIEEPEPTTKKEEVKMLLKQLNTYAQEIKSDQTAKKTESEELLEQLDKHLELDNLLTDIEQSLEEIKEEKHFSEKLTIQEKLDVITEEILTAAEKRKAGIEYSIENIDDKIAFLEEQIAKEKIIARLKIPDTERKPFDSLSLEQLETIEKAINQKDKSIIENQPKNVQQTYQFALETCKEEKEKIIAKLKIPDSIRRLVVDSLSLEQLETIEKAINQKDKSIIENQPKNVQQTYQFALETCKEEKEKIIAKLKIPDTERKPFDSLSLEQLETIEKAIDQKDKSIIENQPKNVQQTYQFALKQDKQYQERIAEARQKMDNLQEVLAELTKDENKKIHLDEQGNFEVIDRHRGLDISIGKSESTQSAIRKIFNIIQDYAELIGDKVQSKGETKQLSDIINKEIDNIPWLKQAIKNNPATLKKLQQETLKQINPMQQYKNAFERAGKYKKLRVSRDGNLEVVKRNKISSNKTSPAAQNLIKKVHDTILEELEKIKSDTNKIESRGKLPEDMDDIKNNINLIKSTIQSMKENGWTNKVYNSLGNEYSMETISKKFEEINNIVTAKSNELSNKSNQEIIEIIINPEREGIRENFLSAYRWVMTTEELFDKLITEYDALNKDAQNRPENLAKIDTIKQIINMWRTDPIINCDERLSEEMEGRIKKMGLPEQRKMDRTPLEITPNETYSESGIVDTIIKGNDKARDKLLDDMADELFKTHAYLFKIINAKEFTKCAWSKKKISTPTIGNYTQFVNSTTYFIMSTILNAIKSTGDDTNEKAAIGKQLIEFFIDLEYKCYKKHDLSATNSIHAAIQSTSIARLWLDDTKIINISQQHKDRLAELEKSNILGTLARNTCKKEYFEANKKNTIIPMLNPFLTCITSADEPEENIKKINSEAILLRQIYSMQERLLDLPSPQSTAIYSAVMNPKCNYTAKDAKDKELYNISVEILPSRRAAAPPVNKTPPQSGTPQTSSDTERKTDDGTKKANEELGKLTEELHQEIIEQKAAKDKMSKIVFRSLKSRTSAT